MRLIKSIEEAGPLQTNKFVKLEKNLIQIGFFSVPKFFNGRKFPKDEKIVKLTKIAADGINTHVEILAPRKIGLPTTGDLTKYLAFQDLVQERFIFNKHDFNEPITFKNYEIFSRLGMTMGGNSYREIQDWMRRMKSTTVEFIASDGKRAGGDIVSVFDRVIYYKEKLDDGTIADCNHVWLSRWEIANLVNKMTVPIDLLAYRQLENETAKILVPHLQTWLYASRENKIFHKNYDDFCNLLGLRRYRSLKEIIRNLTPPMTALIKHCYIKKWEASGSQQTGYKISLWHGAKFFKDLKLYFVTGGGKKFNGDSFESNADNENNDKEYPRLVDREVSPESSVVGEILKTRIDKKDVLPILNKREPDDIRRRIRFCDKLFADAPDKYTSKRGYLYTILNDDDFEVTPDFLEWEENRDSLERDAELRRLEHAEMDRESEARLKLLNDYELFCLTKGDLIDEITFESDFTEGILIWQNFLNLVEGDIHASIFGSWFKSLYFIGFEKSKNIIHITAHKTACDWIRGYYSEFVTVTLKRLRPDNLEIQWLVSEDHIEESSLTKNNCRRKVAISNFQIESGISFDDFCEKAREKAEINRNHIAD